jgi:hypothetical protein
MSQSTKRQLTKKIGTFISFFKIKRFIYGAENIQSSKTLLT